MDLTQVKKELEEGKAVLIDVRERKEWDEGHIQQARLIPLSQLEKKIPEDLPEDKTIYLHCRKGGRATQAEELLKEKYPAATALKYSYDELSRIL